MSFEVITDEAEGVIEGTNFKEKSLYFCRLTKQVALKQGTSLTMDRRQSKTHLTIHKRGSKIA